MKTQELKSVGRYGTLGLEMFLSVLAGYLLGHWIDGKWAGGHGYVTAVGVVAGLYTAVRAVMRIARMATREMEALDEEERRAKEKFLREQGVLPPAEAEAREELESPPKTP